MNLSFSSVWMLSLLCLSLVNVIAQNAKPNHNQTPNACKALSTEFTQPNLVLECSFKFSDKNVISNNCSTTQPHGTVARFYCKEHYEASLKRKFDSNSKYYEIWCNSFGEWEGIKDLEDFRCREECGKLLSKAKPLIINGEVSFRNFFPWHATLFRELRPGTWTYVCGASLIRNQVLLSAAHCFKIDRNFDVDITKFRVVLGSTSSNFSENLREQGTEIHEIQRLYISDNYDPRKGFQADIAVFQLKETVAFSEFISPVCLPNDFTTDVNALKNGEVGLVAGFGVTEEGKLSEILRSAKIKVQNIAECQRSLKRVLPESQFCAGENNDGNFVTLCSGDSGGGFLFLSKVHEKYFIHGIVSSGDASKGLKLCQNYAVFSRVYSFIFWILDVIEEINGEIARELLDNVEYPFALRGSESYYVKFTKLPREWENRITSLDLDYASMAPETLLEALQYARPLTSIKLSHVNFLSDLPTKKSNRVILPVLDSFYLDIARGDFKVDDSRTFPIKLTSQFVHSLIFFEKDYETTWNFETLLKQDINIDIQFHIFKLLHINHAKGEIFLNQIPMANEIFSALKVDGSEFKLRTIALHRSKLKLEEFEQIPQINEISNINLDDIFIPINFESFLKSSKIKTLILNPINLITIDVTHLPTSLKHLSISKTVSLDAQNISQTAFQSLHKFCCENCKLDIHLINTLPHIIPNSKFISITGITIGTVSNLLNMKHLKTLIIQTVNVGKIVTEKFERVSEKDSWTNSVLSEVELRKIHFHCFERDKFWTSEEDYRVKLRLKSFERKALKSGLYEFIGTKSLQTNYPLFPGIPFELQTNIKHIKLESVDIDPRILFDSVSKAYKLESINFVDVVVDSKYLNYQKLSKRSVHYFLKRVMLQNGTVEYIEEREFGKLNGIILPFQGIGKYRNNKYANSLHRIITGLNSYYVDWNTTIHYMLDVTYGELRAQCGYFVGMFGQLDRNNELRQITNSIQRLYDTVIDGVLPKDWKFSGFQLITEEMINGFYQDNALKVFGRLGILEIMLKKYGHLITIESSPNYENLKNPLNFPPIQAISAAYNHDKID